jgi:hypothetical protein
MLCHDGEIEHVDYTATDLFFYTATDQMDGLVYGVLYANRLMTFNQC